LHFEESIEAAKIILAEKENTKIIEKNVAK